MRSNKKLIRQCSLKSWDLLLYFSWSACVCSVFAPQASVQDCIYLWWGGGLEMQVLVWGRTSPYLFNLSLKHSCQRIERNSFCRWCWCPKYLIWHLLVPLLVLIPPVPCACWLGQGGSEIPGNTSGPTQKSWHSNIWGIGCCFSVVAWKAHKHNVAFKDIQGDIS